MSLGKSRSESRPSRALTLMTSIGRSWLADLRSGDVAGACWQLAVSRGGRAKMGRLTKQQDAVLADRAVRFNLLPSVLKAFPPHPAQVTLPQFHLFRGPNFRASIALEFGDRHTLTLSTTSIEQPNQRRVNMPVLVGTGSSNADFRTG